MGDVFIGAITMFAGNYAPVGWALCDGSVLSVSSNQALASLLGSTYGGDGQTTFGLPDLRGRLPVGAGNGGGLAPVALGQTSGQETVTLNSTQIPAHSHPVAASTDTATTQTPGTGVLYGTVTTNANTLDLYTPTPLPPDAKTQTMIGNAVATVGGNQPHENRMPGLVLTFIIATEGIYPPRS